MEPASAGTRQIGLIAQRNKGVLLVTASAQLRTVICALLRKYNPTVAADFTAAIETAAVAGCGSGAGGGFAAAVVDLDLVAATDTTRGGCGEGGPIGKLRVALWGEGGGGIIVGIAPALHATAVQAQEAQHWMEVDSVLQR